MTSCDSNIFYARILRSVIGSTIFACFTAVALSWGSGVAFDPRSLLNAPPVLAAIVAFVVASSRRYARTGAPGTNRFARFTRGLSLRSCCLAALHMAIAWALSVLSPFRGPGAVNVACALAGALYHYEDVYFPRDFHFPIVQTSKYSTFTSGLADTVRWSAAKSLAYVPLVCAALYAASDPKSRCWCGNVRFAFAVWCSVTLVLCLVRSFEHILYLNMTERYVFPVVASHNDGIGLLGALSSDTKIVRSLALYDLYRATIDDAKRRKQIFSLSFAGNVPQSWKIIFSFSMTNIKSTMEEMTGSMKRVLPEFVYRRKAVPNARSLMTDDAGRCYQNNNHINLQKSSIDFLENIRAYNYLFGQLDKEKSLEEFEITVWCCYVLSNLAVVSLKEDEYGVVREQLGDIVGTILNLKSQLELQRKQVDLQNTKNLEYLKTHVKTCAVMLALNFSMYADDIGLDETQLHSFKKLITSLST